MPSFLVIQTAFIGDVVLATALVEKLHLHFPDSSIDFLLRKGNEDLLKGHPFINNVIIWDKKKAKTKNLFKIIVCVRSNHYDYVVNVQRFMSTGLMTALSGARERIGFDKNPLSHWFTRKEIHTIATGVHEIRRNQKLIEGITDAQPARPRLYPVQADYDLIDQYRKTGQGHGYLCIAPTSVWYTKQYPKEKWIELINLLGNKLSIYLLGGPKDKGDCEAIRTGSTNSAVVNLAGELSFLESAALMQFARMNFVNDSAPMHLASAVNAPVAAVFCSTTPDFGFGPLSDTSFIIETSEKLSCRPCGLHGFNACPQGHFKCAVTIDKKQLVKTIEE